MGLSNAIAGSLVWSRLSLAMAYIRKGFPLVDVVSLLLPFSLITPVPQQRFHHSVAFYS
jgi:hypothetical protein